MVFIYEPAHGTWGLMVSIFNVPKSANERARYFLTSYDNKNGCAHRFVFCLQSSWLISDFSHEEVIEKLSIFGKGNVMYSSMVRLYE